MLLNVHSGPLRSRGQDEIRNTDDLVGEGLLRARGKREPGVSRENV